MNPRMKQDPAMKLFFIRMREWFAAAPERFKRSGVPYLRRNLCRRQFLIYAAVMLVLSAVSFPDEFVEFNSASMLPWHKIAGLFLELRFVAPVVLQFTLLLLIYALAQFIPGKGRALFLSLFLTGVALYTLGNAYMVIRYSCPAPEMVIIINSADAQEVREYFSSLFLNNKLFLFSSILFFLLLPVMAAWFFIRTKSPERPAVFAGIIAAAALLAHLLLPVDFPFMFWRHIQAVDFLHRLGEKDFYLEHAAKMVAAPDLPEGSENALKNRTAVAGIVILGESDHRGSHSLYGYEKTTDFEMSKYRSKPGFFIFKDVISATSSTQHSIYFMFSDARIAAKERPGKFAVCEWFQAAGAAVLWYSNQRAHGAWASMAALIFARADELKFFADGTKNTYDRIALLPPVLKRYQELKQKQEPVLFGVHIMGSHYEQQFRIDPKWREQNQAKLQGLDIYDQTVVYTDDFLAEVTAEVESSAQPAFMLYIADHSELLHSDRSLRTPEAVYYEIPVFLYCNAAYRQAFPEVIAALKRACEKPYQSDLTIYLLARLMNMPEKLIPAQADILSGAYRPVPRWIGFGEVVYPEKSAAGR